MTAYLIRRLLVMIPTFLGVSLVIWLVMALSPGEPAGSGGSAGAFDQGPPENLQDLESQNLSARLFRRQFNLDRPLFLNTWTGLETEDVRRRLETLVAGVRKTSPQAVKEARRALEDWGRYAIPALVALLEEARDEPELQTEALRYLRQAAYTFRTVYPAGYQATAEELERDRSIDRENALIGSEEYAWPRGAPPEARRPVVERWQAWYERHREEWAWSTAETIGLALTDTQFFAYWRNVLTGDLGTSTEDGQPVTSKILQRLKYSLSLVVPSFLLAWVLAIFLGVFGATRHGSAADQSIGVGLFILYSIPTFVGGTLLQQWLGVRFGIFPTDGFESAEAHKLVTREHLLDVLHHLVLPMATYTYGSLAYISRQARSGMLGVLKADYVRTARAKGLKERTVIWRHAVRNGMMPIVTLLGTALPVLLGGSLVIEYIFNIDGFGLLMIRAINNKDYNVVMGVQLIVAMLTLIGLLLTDLIYAAMDPRISFK